MTHPIRILLATDHPLIRTGIKAVLMAEKGFTVVGEAEDGGAVKRLGLAYAPDVLLLDLEMPGPPPAVIIACLRHHHPALKVLVLSPHSEAKWVTCLDLTCIAGCILKDEAPNTLVAAVHTVVQGGVWFSQRIVPQFFQRAENGADQMQKPTLTKRELAVLQLVVAGKTNQQIALALNIARRTVGYTLQGICDKFGADSRVEVAVQAVRLGLVE